MTDPTTGANDQTEQTDQTDQTEPPDLTERLGLIARSALAARGIGPDADVLLLNISENATYRVDDPATGERSVLRVHRPGYHSVDGIRSELTWIAALREDGVVSTPAVLPAPGGDLVVPGVHPDGEVRQTVRFAWVEGVEPPQDRLVEDFGTLGSVTARLHEHARGWRRPPGFTRFTWDYATSIGPAGHWGRWQDGMAVGPAELEVLGRLDAVLGRRLAAFGSGPDRFGLVHADMRLANLLVDPVAKPPAEHGSANGGASPVHVIDFDDCGFGWFMYDLGSSLSFIEHDPAVPELIDAWVRGYRQVSPLSGEEEAELETFVLLRRLLLVAWIGSHADTDLAREMGAQFTAVSCDLAERYLSRFG
jgi:Ser/Thr protein kinase RdoA (MazF antagonist)